MKVFKFAYLAFYAFVFFLLIFYLLMQLPYGYGVYGFPMFLLFIFFHGLIGPFLRSKYKPTVVCGCGLYVICLLFAANHYREKMTVQIDDTYSWPSFASLMFVTVIFIFLTWTLGFIASSGFIRGARKLFGRST